MRRRNEYCKMVIRFDFLVFLCVCIARILRASSVYIFEHEDAAEVNRERDNNEWSLVVPATSLVQGRFIALCGPSIMKGTG